MAYIRLSILSFAAVATVFAQPRPSFEVATARPAPEETSANMMHFNGCSGGPGTRDPSQYVCRGLTLRTLVQIAYHMLPPNVSGPSWMDSERYDIFAKPPAGATHEQMPLMLQSLLEERFALKLRRDTRTSPIYALTAPHGSGKLKPSPAADEPEDPAAAAARGRAAGERRRAWGPGVAMMMIDDRHMSLTDLAETLSSRLDRPVRDMTGIAGTFAVETLFAMDVGPAVADDAPHPPTVFEAMDQLGLKLEKRTGDVELLVVQDALKKPREN